MAISFDPNPGTVHAQHEMHELAVQHMRPWSRKYDVQEHDMPWEFVNAMWARATGKSGAKLDAGPGDGMVTVCVQTEELCWGDAGLYLRSPIAAARRFGRRGGRDARTAREVPVAVPQRQAQVGRDGDHRAQAGSDAAAIQTTAVLDGDTNEWVLNGTKIFCTAGDGALDHRGRLRRGLGDGRQVGRSRRHQVVRRDGGHARHQGGRLREEARHPRVGHGDAGASRTAASRTTTCSAARK